MPGQESVASADRERYVAAYATNVARLHAAWDDFASSHRRFALDLDHLIDAPAAALVPFLRDRPDDLAYLRALTAFLRRSVEEWGDALSWGVCHGDLHGGNAHLGADGSVTLFDFDCGGMGYRAYELAVFRWGTAAAWGKDADRFWAQFVKSYGAEHPLAQADLDAVPVFVAIRQLWWMGLQAANADDWGSRRWLGERSMDLYLMRAAHWCALNVPGAPAWECRWSLS